jgi:aspartate racemase
LQQAKEEGVVPADADLSLMGRLIGVYKADVQATLHYHPQVYPGRITYFQSEHSAQKGGDTLKNWQEIAGGGLDLVISPGDHFGMLREPHVQVLATQLQVYLTEVPATLEPL